MIFHLNLHLQVMFHLLAKIPLILYTFAMIIPVQAVYLPGKNPMNHQKVSLNHHYHKTPLNHHESLHYSHVFVMKKNTKMSEAEEGPDRRFPFGLFPRSWENHPFLMGFPSFPPFPPFPVVPRGSPVVPRFCRSGSFYQRLPANAGLLPCREDEAR